MIAIGFKAWLFVCGSLCHIRLIGLPVFTQGGGIGYAAAHIRLYNRLYACRPAFRLCKRKAKKQRIGRISSALVGYAAIYIIGVPYFIFSIYASFGKRYNYCKAIALCFIAFYTKRYIRHCRRGIFSKKAKAHC